MRTYDRDLVSSLFWLLTSIYVFIESARLGIGTLQEPGMGFMSFGVSGLLGIFSLILFLRAHLRKEEVKIKFASSGMLGVRVFMVLIALLLYARLLPVGGYLPSTFLLMTFLFWVVQPRKVWRVLILSFLTTIITYYLFSVWLNCQFPSGLFGL